MIESAFLPYLTTIFPIVCAITLLVLRAGASRVFFDIVGTFQADRLIQDTKAAQTVFEALYLDTFSGIQEGAQEIGQQFTDMLEFVRPVTEEIEEARIQLEKFLDAEAGEMERIANDIHDIGLEFGFAADQSMLAGAKMAQLSGVLGTGSLPVGTEIGMMFGLISGMETDAAMQRLINLQQQTKFMTKNITDEMTEREKGNQIRRDSIRILDQLNTVENRSVATMEQITFVMNQFASQANLTNESIAAMAALSATLIEAGEEQGKGGRALRMMYARLGADINGSRKAVEDLGIAVADSDGNMRAFTDVLVDLAAAYHTMSGEEQTALAQTVAGNRHYTRLIKLLENVERVKELEFEATIAMFPAMDEIERRRQTELFNLQQAESAYKNQVGILGKELLPTLTKVTERQTQLVENINLIAKGPLGFLITMPLAFAKSAQAFAGPAFNMLLSLQNMNIALKTQHAIERSLQGERIASIGTMNGQIGREYNLLELKKQVAKRQAEIDEKRRVARRDELVQGRSLSEREINYARTRSKNLKKEIGEQVRERKKINTVIAKIIDQEKILGNLRGIGTEAERIARSERLIQLGEEKEEQEELIKAIDKANIKRQKSYLLYSSKVEKADENDIKRKAIISELADIQTKKNAKLFNEYTIGLGALGSAFMMVNKGEHTMRIGMALNTLAMAMQTLHTLKQVSANIALMLSADNATKEIVKEGFELGMTTAQLEGATAATNRFSLAQMSLAKKAGAIGAVIAVVGLASMAYEKFGKTSKKVAEELEIAGSLDTQRVMEILQTETDINAELKEKIKLYEVIKDSQDELQKTQAEMLKDEITALKQAQGIKEFSDPDFDISPAKEYFNQIDKLVKPLERERDTWGWMATDIPIINKMIDKQINDAQQSVDKNFSETNKALFDFIELHQITTFEELETAAESFGGSIRELIYGEEQAISDLGQQYDVLTDKVSSFANQREEMFYGFDNNNLTGDLVRQVTQQGVETLVTTTEVIMTNNFNGMTIPQVADMIIEEIENRGNLRGYNLSTA